MSDRLKRTYRYRLYPTPSQAAELERQIGLLCDVYNAALEQRRRMWRDHGVSVGYREQSRQLTDARREHAWLRTMNALAQHGALKRLDRAYEAFFRRCAAGQAPGYPRFRSRRRAASITWPQHGNGCRVVQVGERNGRIELQGVGAVKFRAHRPLPLEAKLGQMTVKCVNGRWWVTIAVELAACERSGGEPDPGGARVVGLDVGVDELVALSTGERVRGPRIARARARAVRRAQRRVSRRRRGSLSRLRAVRTLARAQEQVADARRDHAHKVSRSLADRHAAIAVEDLDVRSMTRSARGTVAEPGRNVRAKAGLNRAIADSGWSQLRELLTYKLEDRGGQLVAVPAQHTSQTCAACGHRAAENRPSRSVFVCGGCGRREHADVNAARVIAQRGEEKLSAVVGASAGQDAENDDDPLLGVESDADTPRTDSQAIVGTTAESPQPGRPRVGGYGSESVVHPPSDRWVELVEVAAAAACQLDTPLRQPSEQLSSSGADSPRSYSAQASRASASSSSVTGSSSSGAASNASSTGSCWRSSSLAAMESSVILDAARPGAGALSATSPGRQECERPADDGGPPYVDGSGETRVEDAAMAAPSKPNPPPQSERARALATSSGAGRDFHANGTAMTVQEKILATPSGAGRDFHHRASPIRNSSRVPRNTLWDGSGFPRYPLGSYQRGFNALPQ